ncbi:MAG: replication-associated recombination protein A [Armatimonadetes bacterium]|nr:replication-associated recombination protein A [Armatimonadota bacterium]
MSALVPEYDDTAASRDAAPSPDAPLAARMRPRALDEFIGQEELVGPGTPLRRAIEEDRMTSAIFWGPPGCGKSTLAWVVARLTASAFEDFSAVTSGVAEMREVMKRARERRKRGGRTILFVDEIHRFNKAQQDGFLPVVEDGTITLIGATTENPFFEVNAPLLSRCRLYTFRPLEAQHVEALLRRAMTDDERGLGSLNVSAEDDALRHLADVSGGDARTALNALELAATEAATHEDRRITLALAEDAAQRRSLRYDKGGDQHYDMVSAFIKSMRGSDPDAAAYWFLRMLDAGEDPRFLARRMVIHASEDVGLADPQALVVATAAAHALEFVGLPEATIPMMQACLYIAAAPKSNAVVDTISRVRKDIADESPGPVPVHLRDSHYRGAKKIGHGAGYRYPHDFPNHFVEQQYLPDGLEGRRYYRPSDNGYEARLKERLSRLWEKDE